MDPRVVISYYFTSADRLNRIPVEDGNLIFVEDERAIYLDAGNERTSYQQIICLQSEAERTALPVPLKGFYFIKDTCVLWRYDDGWYSMTSTPQSQIIFRPRSSFPEEGDSNVIYIDGTDIYRWVNNEYALLNGGSVWKALPAVG